MKSVFTIAAIALTQFASWAQPVANSSNVAANFLADFYYAEATGFSPGGSGPNQTWDFSSLEIIMLGVNTAVPVESTPFASTFPNANYVFKYNGAFLPGDRYTYHNLTATKFEQVTMGYDGSFGATYTDPRTIVTFPYTYNTVFTDTFMAEGDEQITNVTATYDAYGTIIMPFGTLNNVIRQKVVTNGQTNYLWYNVSPFYPILQTVLEENAIGVVIDHTQLSVGDNQAQDLMVYPNPVKDEINIRLSEMTGNYTFTVTNISGQVVINKNLNCNDNSLTFDAQHLTAGIYFLAVTDTITSKTYRRKFIKQ